ncbi:hypothetical protein IEQ34_019050 [Dendrobium chrysotoxum]|uniref:Uncharacterized protein n=1 Tax=Dendrobium chrysotoxum TaxID=161865 RepID=A0AAV7G5T6_DENCH|nr:hypothetical protein IEQ34_019050 [Dendrobium chrysotoxum]
MDLIGLQNKLDDLVSLVGSITQTKKEKHVDSPHSRNVPHSINHVSRKMPLSAYQPRPEPKPRQPHLEPPYRLPTFDGSMDPYYFKEWVRQLDDYFELRDIPESHQVSIAKPHLKELPQLRSANSMELGCDAKGFSRAGNFAETWYCAIVAGRPGLALNKMREAMRMIQKILIDDFGSNGEKIPVKTPVAAAAFKEKRLTFAWLDGGVQKVCQLRLWI